MKKFAVFNFVPDGRDTVGAFTARVNEFLENHAIKNVTLVAPSKSGDFWSSSTVLISYLVEYEE